MDSIDTERIKQNAINRSRHINVYHHRKTQNRKRDVENAHKYLENKHIFVLKTGDVLSGEERTMVGKEAKVLNDALRQVFVTAAMEDPNTTVRLKHWYLKDGR